MTVAGTEPVAEPWEPQPRRWTRDEYYRLVEAGVLGTGHRVELINGEILEMSPQRSPHSATVSLVGAALRALFPVGFHVREQLPFVAGEISEPEPDLAVVTGSPRDYVAQHPDAALLIVEVSDTTLAYDRGTKASLYAQAGVAEYWIVDLPHRCVEVRRDPAAIPGQVFGCGYRSLTIFQGGQEIVPLGAPHGVVAVADLLP